MTKQNFAPKDADTLRNEIVEELGIEYEGNEEMVEKLVDRELKEEQFKASLHSDKTKHLSDKERYKQNLEKAGFDPETGEKVASKESTEEKKDAGQQPALSIKDIRALQNVPDDDIDEVTEYAKFKNISVAEAVNNPVIQSLLRSRAEERASAQATSTSTSKRGSKASESAMLEKVNRQEDMNDDEMAAAAKARINQMKKGS